MPHGACALGRAVREVGEPRNEAGCHIPTRRGLSRTSKHLLFLAGLEIIFCKMNLLARMWFLKILKCSRLHFCIN